jgi:hypothetical protein
MLDSFLREDVLYWFFGLSIVMFVGSLIAIPFILVRLPANYFNDDHPRTWLRGHHPVLRTMAMVGKNVMGVVFLLVGIALLFLPGQGILTMLIGISLIDFPGRRRLERKLISRPAVLQTINKMRKKFGKPPLIVKDEP